MSDAPRVLPAGDRALLVELPDLAGALGMFDALSAAAMPGVLELVPAARTVLLRFDPVLVTAAELAERIRQLRVEKGTSAEGARVEIGVHYDGDDLADVADLLGISAAELIERHTDGDYRVAFGGFAPGFAYLTGGDPLLDVPRRSSPRTRIPAGAVGLAGTFSGVYPRESPGGWQIIGRTEQAMWDLDRDPPATLQPGDRVTFVALDRSDPPTEPDRSIEPAVPVPPAESPRPIKPHPATQPDPPPEHAAPIQAVEIRPALIIVNPGALALIQDEGRPGLAALGVARSGALDVRSLHTANRLVGNPSDLAAIEFSFGGEVRAVGDLIVGVAGERLDLTRTHADGRAENVPDQRPIALHDGDTLTLAPTLGVRGYLAVRGGLDLPVVLGSRGTDTMSCIGPAPLTAGAALAIGSANGFAPVDRPQPWPGRLSSEPVNLPVLLGPRDDWFTEAALDLFFTQPWTVTPRSDRVGVRLRGEHSLARLIDGELPSEGAVSGAVQIPPDGQPVLFLADHPVTGGYPVIAVLHSSALDLAGQLAPGTAVRFTKTARR